MPSPRNGGRSRWIALAWAVLGGGFLASGAPPLSSRVGPFVAVALLGAGLHALAGRRPAFAGLVGLAFGGTAHAIGLASIGGVFERYGGLSPLLAYTCAPLLWLLQSLPFGLACAATLLCMRESRLAPVFLACALCACGSLVPQIFPFQLGALAAPWLWLSQVAELSGTSLVSLCVAGTGLAAHAILRARTFAAGPLLALLGSFVLPQAYGALRAREVHNERALADSLRVAVIQPNVRMEELASEPGQERALELLREATRELEGQHPDLTVWPESAYPFRLARVRKQQPLQAARTITRGTPVLFGAITYGSEGTRELEYNSAWLVEGSGALGGRVDKKHLLPFAEYIPLWHALPSVRARYRSPGLESGASGRVRVSGSQLGVLICYEDLVASLAREHARSGAAALVNLTNDGWFGTSSEPALHDALARMRSIETRRDLLRATNTGVSSLTAATGERLEQTEPFERASFVTELRLMHTRTPYTRFGDWVSPLCLLVCLGLALDARRFR
jgi:apolipoprotein N-acyltransferase